MAGQAEGAAEACMWWHAACDEKKLQSADPKALAQLQDKYNFRNLAMICIDDENMNMLLSVLCSMSDKEKREEKFPVEFPGKGTRLFEYDEDTQLLCHCNGEGTLLIAVNNYLASQWKTSTLSTPTNSQVGRWTFKTVAVHSDGRHKDSKAAETQYSDTYSRTDKKARPRCSKSL